MNPEIPSVGSILAGIFVATAIFIWQVRSQSSRVESKTETQGEDLRSAIETQGKELRAEMRELRRELRADIETHGKRVSEVELEQARLDGVNSVMMNQTYIHQSAAD